MSEALPLLFQWFLRPERATTDFFIEDVRTLSMNLSYNEKLISNECQIYWYTSAVGDV